MSLIGTILTIYIWGIVCGLLYFLFAIARFYQRKSGRRSYYQAFLVAAALFALAALRDVLWPRPLPAMYGAIYCVLPLALLPEGLVCFCLDS